MDLESGFQQGRLPMQTQEEQQVYRVSLGHGGGETRVRTSRLQDDYDNLEIRLH